jgi:hypothetical protein
MISKKGIRMDDLRSKQPNPGAKCVPGETTKKLMLCPRPRHGATVPWPLHLACYDISRGIRIACGR